MKKIIALILVLVMCCSLTACGDSLEKQADEVAEKLEGTWTFSWDAPIGKMKVVFSFSSINGNAGMLTEKMYMDGTLIQHYTGSFGVSIQEDGVIECVNQGSIGKDGSIQKLETPSTYTLSYTYEDGVLTLTYSGHSVSK